MNKLHLIMPMGGAGSRFFKDGFVMPKPLIEINNKPFFYWATQSLLKFFSIETLTFVVLKEHIVNFKMDEKILEYYPQAKIIVIPDVLPGPVLTCLEGIRGIDDDLPILFNDCDHMFKCSEFNNIFENYSQNINFDGGLFTFLSNQPQFSYVEYDSDGKLIGTIEKKVVSNHAICGAYTFRNAKVFHELCEEYLRTCKYEEYFISGVYNVMCARGMIVRNFVVDFHVTFGTPDEYEVAKNSKYFAEIG